MHGLMSYRRFGMLELGRYVAERTLGRYVANELWLKLGLYVAT